MVDYNNLTNNNYNTKEREVPLEAKSSRLEIECSSCEDIDAKLRKKICEWYYCPKIQILVQ